jgi:hypothetical protein
MFVDFVTFFEEWGSGRLSQHTIRPRRQAGREEI